MNADTTLSPRGPTEILYALQKYSMPYRNTQSISVGVRGTEVLATIQASDVRPGHGTKALIWGMT